jgi:hypothetical protein
MKVSEAERRGECAEARLEAGLQIVAQAAVTSHAIDEQDVSAAPDGSVPADAQMAEGAFTTPATIADPAVLDEMRDIRGGCADSSGHDGLVARRQPFSHRSTEHSRWA